MKRLRRACWVGLRSGSCVAANALLKHWGKGKHEYTKWTQTMTYVNTTEDTMADKLSAEILKILKEESDPWNEATSKDLRYQFYNISEIKYAIDQGIMSYLLDLRDQRLEGIAELNKNET